MRKLVLFVVVVVTVMVIILVATGKIDQIENPFGGCAIHPGECGVDK